MWQTAITLVLSALLLWLLYRGFERNRTRQQRMPEQILGPLRSVIEHAEIGPGETAGVYVLRGSYNGADVAIRAVVDLLMLRKLPSLWLMVTLPGETTLPATLDLMLRPAGQSSFSNFDTLPVTLDPSAAFPEQAVLRSDTHEGQSLVPLLAKQRQLLSLNRLKEVLMTPKGLRVVTLLAEGERARYGVYRQAEFGGIIRLARSGASTAGLAARLEGKYPGMEEKPVSPYKVLAASLVPGAGHVLLGLPQRGLTFLFFMVVFGWISYRLMPETATFLGRHIGGLFIYGISILDAYKTARIRWEVAKRK